MGIKLSLLALVIALLSGCTTINDNVINPIKGNVVNPIKDRVINPILINPIKNYIINPIKPFFRSPATSAGTTSQIPKSSEGTAIGVYEHRRGGVIYRRVLLKNGILEYYLDGSKVGESRWAEKNGKILVIPDGGKVTDFLKFESNGDLSWIATTQNGARKEIEKLTFKKIK